jgi:hypothetical protein
MNCEWQLGEAARVHSLSIFFRPKGFAAIARSRQRVRLARKTKSIVCRSKTPECFNCARGCLGCASVQPAQMLKGVPPLLPPRPYGRPDRGI